MVSEVVQYVLAFAAPFAIAIVALVWNEHRNRDARDRCSNHHWGDEKPRSRFDLRKDSGPGTPFTLLQEYKETCQHSGCGERRTTFKDKRGLTYNEVYRLADGAAVAELEDED